MAFYAAVGSTKMKPGFAHIVSVLLGCITSNGM